MAGTTVAIEKTIMSANRQMQRSYKVMPFMATLFLAAGCASSGEPVPEVSGKRALCPPGLTPSCVEYIRKKMRCFCGTTEDLREILEPNDIPTRN
jgi:hypothetical protein